MSLSITGSVIPLHTEASLGNEEGVLKSHRAVMAMWWEVELRDRVRLEISKQMFP